MGAACFAGVCGARRFIPADLREKAISGFARSFGTDAPTDLGVAPGRAEVLGNHTDYNEGYILAAAVDRYIVVAGRKTEEDVIRVASESYPDSVVICPRNSLQKQSGKMAWSNYMMGVVDELEKAGAKVGSFDAYVTSNVPTGAGVSSSAALEMATASLLARLFPDTVGKLSCLDLIKVSKAAENNFVGMGCGILDQFSSGMGRAKSLLFLDCRTLEHTYAPFRGAEFVLANTNAPHQLVDGKYDELRRACFAAAASLGKATGLSSITHLRDVDSSTLEQHAHTLNGADLNRAKHIVYENERVEAGVQALKRGDLEVLGRLMSESHASSRDLFGNSCKELDVMQDCAQGIDGFLGARLMGGGFGGSTINLVADGKAEAFGAELAARYEAKVGRKATILICSVADGAWGTSV